MNYMMIPILIVKRNKSGSIYFISQCEAKNKSMLEAELMEVQYLLVKRLINIIVVDKEKTNIKQ